MSPTKCILRSHRRFLMWLTAATIIDRSIHRSGVILISLTLLAVACTTTSPSIDLTPLTVTPEPTATATPVHSPTPDASCLGWWCTLTGTVYSDAAGSGRELADATVMLYHFSYCSPTSGHYTITTGHAGEFAFQVYLHDTDSFSFRAEKAGAQPAEKKFGGFDCLYCSCQPLELVLSSSPVTPTQALSDLSEAAEAWRLLGLYGDRVWPGWGQAPLPFLIRSGEFDLLIGHPTPPAEFKLMPDKLIADQPVYRYEGHLLPVPAATTWEVAGVWSVAVPTRAEFQQAIDAQLGAGVVDLDEASYVRTIVHEAFHAYTFQIVNGQLPSFGSDVEEHQLIEKLSARPELDKQHTAEGQALVKALQALDDQTARQAAREFLHLRRTRRAGEQDVAAYEQLTEWVEGLARYAEVSLMQLAGQETDTAADNALHNTINYPAANEVWQQFLDQLAQPATSPDGFRGRYYLLGAGQFFLLDRFRPDWKAHLFDEKSSLEALLQETLQ